LLGATVRPQLIVKVRLEYGKIGSRLAADGERWPVKDGLR